MLPAFRGPVRWCLGALGQHAELDLLRLEQSEFEAVLGQPVVFDPTTETAEGPEIWSVVVDTAQGVPVLRAFTEARRIVLVLPSADRFLDGLNLLHSLAHTRRDEVTDTDVDTYAEAFDRIHAEISNIFPSFGLRGLDWESISSTYGYVRELSGDDFWRHAQRWVAELGEAHTQLFHRSEVFNPPYGARMTSRGALLTEVPTDSAAWRAGIVPGDVVEVDDPDDWVRRVGASPQQRPMIAARRYLAMTTTSRHFTARTQAGNRVAWTEAVSVRCTVQAAGNHVRIRAVDLDLPERLAKALRGADPAHPLTLDLRGNVGGTLVAADRARRLLVRKRDVFGSIAFTNGRGGIADPQQLSIRPSPDAWPGSLRVLVDSMTYSAAEDLIHPLVGAAHVEIIGGPTGGGSGRPHTRRIKDGYSLATSTAITYTRDGEPIEYYGIKSTSSGTP